MSRLLVMAIGLMLPCIGWAAPLLQPLIELVPPSTVVADGTTTAQLHLIALHKDGKPIEGMKLTPSARQGRVGALSEVSPGVYRFGYVPPKLEQPMTVAITVRGKTPDKRQVNVRLDLPIEPSPAYALDTLVSPTAMQIGADGFATLTVSNGAPSGALAARSSVGSLGAPVRMADGEYKLRLTAGEEAGAHLAIVTAVDHGGQGATFGYAVIPQLESRTLELPLAGVEEDADSSADVVLTVATREFGPVRASGEADVSMPVLVPPGVASAAQQTVVGGAVHDTTVELETQTSRSLLFFPVPAAVPADPAVEVPVRIVILDQTGQPAGNEKPVLTASAGQIELPVHVRDGIYTADFTPPSAPGTVTLDVALGEEETQRDQVQIEVLPVLAANSMEGATSVNPVRHVVVVPWGEQVRSNGIAEMGLTVVTVDGYGQPVADAEVVLSVVDDKGLIMPTLRTNEHGWADATYTAGGTECLVQIQASAGNATGTASFIQSPDTVTWSSHPRSGSDSLRGLEETWAAAVAASQSAAVAEPSEPETTE